MVLTCTRSLDSDKSPTQGILDCIDMFFNLPLVIILPLSLLSVLGHEAVGRVVLHRRGTELVVCYMLYMEMTLT